MPGKPFVFDRIMQMKKGLAETPIIGGMADIAPDDVIEYQVERMFEFKFKLEEKQI